MTYLSKPQAFLTDKAKELVGCTIVCQRDTGAGYFTEGKEYQIYMDGTGCPYIFNDFDGQCRQSASTFVLKQLPLTPKQPKVGEVWAIRSSAFTDNSLYWIDRVEAGLVYNRHIRGGARHCEPVERFLEEHTFVF